MLNKLSVALSVLAFTPTLIQAHGQLSWVKVAGKEYPAWNLDDHYKAAYKKQDPQYGEQPQQKYTRKTDRLDLGPTDIFSKSIATGGYQDSLDYDDISPVGVIPAKAGDEVTVQWDHHWPQGHPGPIGEWMAKCPGDSCSKVDGTTLDWFCIAQHNYDAQANDWPTEIMTRSQNRQWTFKLPNDLPGGAYIVRHAVYALHNNTGPVAGTTASPQTYPVSFEIDLQSSGTELPTLTGRLPGMFSYDDYEWHRDIYSDQYNNLLTKWEFPGVAVYPGGYTTGVVNGKTASSGASAGSPAPAGNNNSGSTPTEDNEDESTSTTSDSASSITAEAAASSTLPVQNGAVVDPSSTASPAAAATTSSAPTAQRTCRVRTSEQQRKKKRAAQQARHQRRARTGLGRKH